MNCSVYGHLTVCKIPPGILRVVGNKQHNYSDNKSDLFDPLGRKDVYSGRGCEGSLFGSHVISLSGTESLSMKSIKNTNTFPIAESFRWLETV